MTEQIINLINNNIPFVFIKLGDGEYSAANGYNGTNCDGDRYTNKLQNGLNDAVKYFSLKDNIYYGRWHADNVVQYFNSVAKTKLNWADYHTFIVDTNSLKNKIKLNLFKAIKESKRKKIIIGNPLLAKAKYLLNISEHVIIPYRNWYDNGMEQLIEKIKTIYKDDDEPLIITCAGMGAKILIMELHKIFNKGIFIDIGSGLDYICTKKCSRGHPYTYNELEEYFKEILPENWNDSNFEEIYHLARYNIGLHLPPS
jgi:hypothetical protein